MLCLTESIRPNDPSMQCVCRAAEDARARTELIVTAWKLARVLAVDIVEYVLTEHPHGMPHRVAQFVTVDRRIAPPPAVSERSVPVSEHSTPQCREAGHAYRAGGSPHSPAFSHRGSDYAALAGS